MLRLKVLCARLLEPEALTQPLLIHTTISYFRTLDTVDCIQVPVQEPYLHQLPKTQHCLQQLATQLVLAALLFPQVVLAVMQRLVVAPQQLAGSPAQGLIGSGPPMYVGAYS